MINYKCVMDVLIEAIQDEKLFMESNLEVKNRLLIEIKEDIEANIEDSNSVVLNLSDLITIVEKAAYIQGICGGIKLHIYKEKPKTVEGCSSREEVMQMYITLTELLAFSTFVIALIALINQIKHK